MKSLVIIILISLGYFTQVNDRFAKSMQANIEELYAAQSIEALQAVANKFERIATVEKEEWLPGYYGSLAYIWMATREQDKPQLDKWLDQAQTMLDKSLALQENNSEVTALQGFIYMMRVTVDPASRGQVYSQKAFAEFGKAVSLDERNPRAMFFKGQMEHGTAQFFKMDTAPACGTMAKSLELFDNFTPESSIHPNWGQGYAKKTVEICQ